MYPENDKQLPVDFNIYRWYYWRVERWDIIPVWWSVFSDRASSFLEIDDMYILNPWITQEQVCVTYNTQKDSIESWLQLAGINIPSFLFFILMNIQAKVHKNLEVDTNQRWTQKRTEIYSKQRIIKLSDLKWNTACAERAALWVFFSQILWLDANYMSWYTFYQDIDDGANHSWIVISFEWASYIFDIARPIISAWTVLPNVYKINWEINMERFQKTDNYFIEATKIVWLTNRYFWVNAGRMSDDIPNIVQQILED